MLEVAVIGVLTGGMALFAGGQALRAGLDQQRFEQVAGPLRSLHAPASADEWQQLLGRVDEADRKYQARLTGAED